MRLVDGHQVDLRGREGVDRDALNRRFRPKFQALDSNECWPWLASTNEQGRGMFWLHLYPSDARSTSRPAPRCAYHFFVAPVPEELAVCHRCDNPNCVNPWHLFLGSYKDNMVDMRNKGRAHWQQAA